MFCFLLGNLVDFNLIIDVVVVEDFCEVDCYMFVKLNKLIDKVKKFYDLYEFLSIYYVVYNFCIIDMSLFYLDFVKDVLYIEVENNVECCSI